MKAKFIKHRLEFKRPSGTSRGVLTTKDSWFILLTAQKKPGVIGIGECSIIKGLSPDNLSDFETRLHFACKNINSINTDLKDSGLGLEDYPAIRFGLQNALWDLENNGTKILFDSPFTRRQKSIPINGLIWMGEPDFMQKQIEEKLSQGFDCIKMKIGAIDFEQEIALLKGIRNKFPADQIELRVDANGAFDPKDALEKLQKLADLDIHSIEQPIKQGQWKEMAKLCAETPLPIALDEELIGIYEKADKKQMLQIIQPQYIILKPSLHDGFQGANEWIQIAEELNILWWATSALESNIGLNAIAQWTSTFKNALPQGLGTGSLFTNNVDAPLQINQGNIKLTEGPWDLWEIYSSVFREIKINGETIDLNQADPKEEGFKTKVIQFLATWISPQPFHEIQTSGSTGSPKTVRLPKSSMVESALKTGQVFKLKPNQNALICLPVDYIAGQLMAIRALVLGMNLITVEPSRSPLKNIGKKIDFAALTPMQVEKSLNDLKKIDQLIIGGAPLARDTRVKLKEISTRCYETYSMTETITHVAIKEVNNKTSYFHAIPGVHFTVNKDSCLIIHADHLANSPIQTNDVVDLHDDQQFEWKGRKDNVINTGGIKIHPELVESKLQSIFSNPFFIIGQKHPTYGEAVTLVVETDRAISSAQIKEIENTLEPFEIPKSILTTRNFVYTKSGKVHRQQTLTSIQDREEV